MLQYFGLYNCITTEHYTVVFLPSFTELLQQLLHCSGAVQPGLAGNFAFHLVTPAVFLSFQDLLLQV